MVMAALKYFTGTDEEDDEDNDSDDDDVKPVCHGYLRLCG